jgi:cytochrome oxidase Cu insertion factor (SCO1/SenC/PrrC family)
LVAGVSPAWASAPAQPPNSVGVATSTPLTAAAASAKFVNQRGTPETLGALKGKIVLVVPLLTLCGDTCPFTSGNLLQLQTTLNRDGAKNVEVVAIDVDPYRDNLARISAYAHLFNANFQIWTEQGYTSKPALTKAELASKNPVGTGDINANLSAIERFLSWSVQVVPQSTPPPTDWMAPYEKLTYDISHSDGFWIINRDQVVRFLSGTKPAFTGTLSKALATFMGYKSNIYKNPVYRGGWTPAEALQAIEWVAGRSY